MANLSPDNPASSGPSGASGGGGSDDELPFRSPASVPPRTDTRYTFQYLKKSSAEGGGRNVEEDQWIPFVFQLIPPENSNSNVEKSELYKEIRLAGGTIYPGKDVETDINGVVRILNEAYFVDNEEKDFLVPLDTYSSVFVYLCINKRSKGLPSPHPSSWLIPSSTSKYVSYDARRILRRELKWEDIGKRDPPPNHKRISAQQWIELQRRRAPQNPDARKTVDGPNGQERKSSAEPADADKDKSRTLTPSPKRREVPIVAMRLSTSPPPSSNGPSEDQESEHHGSEPVAGPSRLHYASSTLKPRRLQFQANEPGSSTSSRKDSQRSANGFAQRAQDPPVPRASTPKPSTSSKLISQSPPSSPAAVSASPSPSAPCSSKTNGELATTCQQSSSSASPSSSRSSENVTVTSRQQINLKVVATAGSSGSRRDAPKPQPRPARDDDWVDCEESSGGSSNDSVHFSDTSDDDDDDVDESSGGSTYDSDDDGDDYVDVKPKLQPLRKRRRQLYSTRESQRVLDLVGTLNAYLYVKCPKFWKQVEGSKKFKNRTYQSLWEHFRRAILPKVTSDKKDLASTYKITPENLVKLKKGWNNKHNKYHIVCPDFKM